MSKVLVVGDGCAGFCAAWHPEKRLRRGQAEVVAAPRPYLTCQPFLPEVTAGPVETRHADLAAGTPGALTTRRSTSAATSVSSPPSVRVEASSSLVRVAEDIVSLQSVQHSHDAFVHRGVPGAHR